MTTAWWTEESGRWFALLGFSGLLVPVLVWHASRARHRTAVLGTWVSVAIVFAVIAAVGFFAKMTNQPEYVWKPLVYAGVFTAVPYAATYAVMRNRYVRAELRKTLARDI